MTDSNLCFYCNSIDTIEHHLFLCPKTSKVWEEILAWVRSTLNINFEQGYAICEIIFGYHLFETVYSVTNHIHNIVILIGKWYINKTRIEQEDLFFVRFLYLLKSKFEIYIAMYSTKTVLKERSVSSI